MFGSSLPLTAKWKANIFMSIRKLANTAGLHKLHHKTFFGHFFVDGRGQSYAIVGGEEETDKKNICYDPVWKTQRIFLDLQLLVEKVNRSIFFSTYKLVSLISRWPNKATYLTGRNDLVAQNE